MFSRSRHDLTLQRGRGDNLQIVYDFLVVDGDTDEAVRHAELVEGTELFRGRSAEGATPTRS